MRFLDVSDGAEISRILVRVWTRALIGRLVINYLNLSYSNGIWN